MLLASGCTGSPDRVVEPGEQLAIRGVVRNAGTGAPEAGVWVIAETQSLPTPFRQIVVTEDEGRFVVPNLPDGTYEVFVRGYGLRDSMPVAALRGDELALTVSTAQSPQEAAAIYPGQLLVVALSSSGRGPATRRVRGPGRVDRQHETGLHAMPSVRRSGVPRPHPVRSRGKMRGGIDHSKNARSTGSARRSSRARSPRGPPASPRARSRLLHPARAVSSATSSSHSGNGAGTIRTSMI